MSATFSVNTKRQAQFINITVQIELMVMDSKIKEGIAVVFVPHTTAGVTINESNDSHVQRDILTHLDGMVPQSGDYLHSEGNSPAHIKASLMGSSVTVPIVDGRLKLGTWQGIFFCEFDGPRARTVRVILIEE
jgi:secondary thiamine-phosphate synthase enzyme